MAKVKIKVGFSGDGGPVSVVRDGVRSEVAMGDEVEVEFGKQLVLSVVGAPVEAAPKPKPGPAVKPAPVAVASAPTALLKPKDRP